MARALPRVRNRRARRHWANLSRAVKNWGGEFEDHVEATASPAEEPGQFRYLRPRGMTLVRVLGGRAAIATMVVCQHSSPVAILRVRVLCCSDNAQVHGLFLLHFAPADPRPRLARRTDSLGSRHRRKASGWRQLPSLAPHRRNHLWRPFLLFPGRRAAHHHPSLPGPRFERRAGDRARVRGRGGRARDSSAAGWAYNPCHLWPPFACCLPRFALIFSPCNRRHPYFPFMVAAWACIPPTLPLAHVHSSFPRMHNRLSAAAAAAAAVPRNSACVREAVPRVLGAPLSCDHLYLHTTSDLNVASARRQACASKVCCVLWALLLLSLQRCVAPYQMGDPELALTLRRKLSLSTYFLVPAVLYTAGALAWDTFRR